MGLRPQSQSKKSYKLHQSLVRDQATRECLRARFEINFMALPVYCRGLSLALLLLLQCRGLLFLTASPTFSTTTSLIILAMSSLSKPPLLFLITSIATPTLSTNGWLEPIRIYSYHYTAGI